MKTKIRYSTLFIIVSALAILLLILSFYNLVQIGNQSAQPKCSQQNSNLFTKVKEVEIVFPDQKSESIVYTHIQIIKVQKIRDPYSDQVEYKLVIRPLSTRR